MAKTLLTKNPFQKMNIYFKKLIQSWSLIKRERNISIKKKFEDIRILSSKNNMQKK